MYTDRDIEVRHEFLVSVFRDVLQSGININSDYGTDSRSVWFDGTGVFSMDTAYLAQTFLDGVFSNKMSPTKESALSVRLPNLIPGSDMFRDTSNLIVDYNRRCLEITNQCLYLDSVWIADPAEALANWIDREKFPNIAQGVDFSGYGGLRNSLQACFAFNALEPLIKANIVKLYPHSQLFFDRVSEVIFDMNRDFTNEEIRNSFPDLYVAEGIAFSNALNVSYMANSKDEWKALQNANLEVSKLIGGIDERTITGIQSISLPEFASIDATDLASARLQEESFEEIRAILKMIGQEISVHPFDPQFIEEVRRIETDRLAPELQKLRDGINFSTSVRDKMSSSAIEFCAMVLSGVAASGAVLASLAGAATGVLSAAIIRSLVERKSPNPALSLLMKSANSESNFQPIKRFLLSDDR